jgi:hypothetical protein
MPRGIYDRSKMKNASKKNKKLPKRKAARRIMSLVPANLVPQFTEPLEINTEAANDLDEKQTRDHTAFWETVNTKGSIETLTLQKLELQKENEALRKALHICKVILDEY